MIRLRLDEKTESKFIFHPAICSTGSLYQSSALELWYMRVYFTYRALYKASKTRDGIWPYVIAGCKENTFTEVDRNRSLYDNYTNLKLIKISEHLASL